VIFLAWLIHYNQQPTTNNQQPTTSNQQPATSNQQPATSNQQPATNNQQPATSNQQPETSNQQPMMQTLWQDLRYGARMLLNNPGFTGIAVITLALGIGANSAIFSVVDKMLLRPLPVLKPSELVMVGAQSVNPSFRMNIFSYPNFKDYREQNEVFSDMLAYTSQNTKLGVGEQAEKIDLEMVSGNYFQMLGLSAVRGRMIVPDDDRLEDSGAVAVLSYESWRRRFGGRPDIVGQSLTLNGANYTIVGVAPAGFSGMRLEIPVEAWVPLSMRRPLSSATTSRSERKNMWLRVMGRLKPGVELARAQQGIDLTARRIWLATTPESDQKLPYSEKRMLLEPGGRGDSSLRRTLGATMKLLLGVTALLLLLACANVANLLLARGTTRRKEIAVRLALGASRWRLIRQLMVESLMIAFLGAIAGLLLTPWIYELLLAFEPGFVLRRSAFEGSLDWRVLLFTALATSAAALLFGLAPAWQSVRTDLIPALKDAVSGATFKRRRLNPGQGLVVAQVALALIMLIGAGLLVRSLQRLFAIDPGFQTENLLIVPIDLPQSAYAAAKDDAARRAVDESNNQYFTTLVERIKGLPGVNDAATALITPMADMISQTGGVEFEGREPRPGENIGIDSNRVGPGYYELMGIEFVAGRGFNENDQANAQGVVVINEAMAKMYFPNQNAVGKRLRTRRDKTWLEVIGVTRDYRLHSLTETPTPHFDFPSSQSFYGNFTRLVVKTSIDPMTVYPSVRKEALALNSGASIEKATTLREELRKSIAASRMASTLTTLFGATALLLAAIGLYGVMSQMVNRRTREVGVRMALGAQTRDVLRLVLKQGLLLVAVGLAIGLTASFWLTRLLKASLYNVTTTDPLTFLVVAMLLASIALFACWIPARRATKVDPIEALRVE
jgi:macrolide transport system ATP-binding/permease protein